MAPIKIWLTLDEIDLLVEKANKVLETYDPDKDKVTLTYLWRSS